MYIVDKEKDFETNTNYEKIKNNRKKEIWNVEVKKNSSPIDIVIFKMKFIEVWDIPRACMFLQIRSTDSEFLTKQVIWKNKKKSYFNKMKKLW